MPNRDASTIEQRLQDKENLPGLLEEVQQTLREIASRAIHMQGEQQYWVTTELMGEINLRLLRGGKFPAGVSRAEFFGYVVTMTRHILLGEARKRKRQKAGGTIPHDSVEVLVETHQEPAGLTIIADEWIDVARNLEALQEINEKYAVALGAFLQGYTLQQIADEMGVSVRTAGSYVKAGKIWIKKRIEGRE